MTHLDSTTTVGAIPILVFAQCGLCTQCENWGTKFRESANGHDPPFMSATLANRLSKDLSTFVFWCRIKSNHSTTGDWTIPVACYLFWLYFPPKNRTGWETFDVENGQMKYNQN
jgi:hypothetical protein